MAVDRTRKNSQPYRASLTQTWGQAIIGAQHEEALYAFGELALYTMMWRPTDHSRGLVDLCSLCTATDEEARYVAAFGQAEQRECPVCFGTTFQGGFRAQIVRPTIFADRNQESTDEARGALVRDTLQFETTADFTLHKGDYVFRFDGSRFQVEEKGEGVVRDGFTYPLHEDGFVGGSTAHREETTSVAHRIPTWGGLPLDQILLRPADGFLVPDIARDDQLATNGYIS